MLDTFTSEELWVNAEVGTIKVGEHVMSHPATLEVDRGGKMVATLTYTCLWEYIDDITETLSTRTHPDFSDYPMLHFDSLSATREEAGLTTITVTYKGVTSDTPDDDGDSKGEEGTELWAMSSSVEEAPIRTLQKFAKMATVENAIFESDGSFKDWKLMITKDGKEVKNPLYGITTYLRPASSLQRVLTRKIPAGAACDLLTNTLLKVGYIYEEINTVKPNWLGDDFRVTENDEGIRSGRNVLLVSANAEELGKEGMRITQDFLVSGDGGFPEEIYKK